MFKIFVGMQACRAHHHDNIQWLSSDVFWRQKNILVICFKELKKKWISDKIALMKILVKSEFYLIKNLGQMNFIRVLWWQNKYL